MSTYADLIFSPFCNALVASLASRAHQWCQWEILQVYRAELAPQPSASLFVVQRWVELRIQIEAHKSPTHLRAAWHSSPSIFIREALSTAPKNPPSNAELGKWDQDAGTLCCPQIGPLTLDLHDLAESLPNSSFLRPEELLSALKNDTPTPKAVCDIRYRNYLGKSLHWISN